MLRNHDIVLSRPRDRRRSLCAAVPLLTASAAALALLIAGALGLGPISSAGASSNATVSTAGSCHGPADFGAVYLGSSWPGGFQGVPVYSNGVSGSFTDCLHSTRTPQGRVVVDGYEWQCVELVNRLYLSKGWIESSWLGNGNQLYANAPRGLSRQPQGHITYVHPGDVISFNAPGGGAGHAAVVGRVQGNYLTIVNQNTDRASVLSHAYLRSGRIEMVGWAGWGPIGVVHAPAAAPRLVVSPTALGSTAVNNGLTHSLAASGGTTGKHWAVTAGTPPLGVNVTPAGQVSGVAMTTGSYAFAATVRDSAGQAASEGLRMHVSTNANLLRDPDFSTVRLHGWHVDPVDRSDVVHARSVLRARGVPSGSSDLVLSSSAPGGALSQDVSVNTVPGDSYTFSAWVRRDPSDSARTSACLRLIALTAAGRGRALGHGVTCRSVDSTWQHVSVPFDINPASVRALRAQVVTESGHSTLDVAGTQLEGNGLAHAAFSQDNAAGWQLLAPAGGGRVNGRAYAAAPGRLPVGTNYFQLNTGRPGGSVYQDLDGVLPVGQGFRLSTWVRSNSGKPIRVCLAVWGLGRTASASKCQFVRSAWTFVAVSYRVHLSGQRDLRAQLYVDEARLNVDVNGMSLENTPG